MRNSNNLQLAFLGKLLAMAFLGTTIGNNLSTPGFAQGTADNRSNAVNSVSKNRTLRRIRVGSQPDAIVVSPDSRLVYVANWDSDTVSVISAEWKTVVSTIPVGACPTSVAVSTDGRTLYVANYCDNTVSVIDTKYQQVVATVSVGNSPNWVAVSPGAANSQIYVANEGDGTVSVIDSVTNQVTGDPIAVGGLPQALLFTPNGSSAYLVSDYAPPNDLVLIDVASQTFTHVGDPQITEKGLSILPDGSTLYAINLESDSVLVLDCASEQVVQEIPAPRYVNLNTTAISPDGKNLYVAGTNELKSGGEIWIVDTTKNAFVGKWASFPEGSNAIAIAPNGRALYTTELGRGTVTIIPLDAQ
ncbi:MAG: beta-propeller fold lactonase family protein [Verrucomicrobia bacterium]|nr:beta-propeller fold lactonase family protein [Verrucomicrobiota bacterium]